MVSIWATTRATAGSMRSRSKEENCTSIGFPWRGPSCISSISTVNPERSRVFSLMFSKISLPLMVRCVSGRSSRYIIPMRSDAPLDGPPGIMVCRLMSLMPSTSMTISSTSDTSSLISYADILPCAFTRSNPNCGSESEKKIAPFPKLL